jgi:transcriptional regulator with XRE-family HTH domain
MVNLSTANEEEIAEQRSAKPALARAVKALRLGLGDTQQQFANRLDIAISSAVRYETNRPPSGEILSRLYWLAVNHGLSDVAELFQRAVFEEWREWGKVPDAEPVTEHLENRFMQALSDALVTRGSTASTRVAEWSFMRCAQKMLSDDQYKHLRAPFAAMIAPMCEELVEEATQTLSEMLKDSPQRDELMQGLMVSFVAEHLPREFFDSRIHKKKVSPARKKTTKKSKSQKAASRTR